MSVQSKISFKKGDVIVYPKNGVGFIEKIDTVQFDEEDFQAFFITLKATGVSLMIPVDEAQEKGLRHVHSSKDIEIIFKLLSQKISSKALTESKTWKERKAILEDLFAVSNIENLVEIIKYLYDKNQEKLLPNSERRIYDFSLKFLIDELAESKNISEEESEHKIAEILIQNPFLNQVKNN